MKAIEYVLSTVLVAMVGRANGFTASSTYARPQTDNYFE